jgi:hypothetical protein
MVDLVKATSVEQHSLASRCQSALPPAALVDRHDA